MISIHKSFYMSDLHEGNVNISQIFKLSMILSSSI